MSGCHHFLKLRCLKNISRQGGRGVNSTDTENTAKLRLQENQKQRGSQVTDILTLAVNIKTSEDCSTRYLYSHHYPIKR